MPKLRLACLLIPCLAFPLGYSPAQTPTRATAHFHFTGQRGPHPVGLKVVQQYDYTRVYLPATDELGKPTLGERARPIQTLIWYPAAPTTAKQGAMTVADYGALSASELNFTHPAISPRDQEWIKSMTPALGDAMWAVRDASMAPGRFPVVIYAPSFSAMSWENADLCEYLASHGYVVIASPDLGVHSRNMTDDIPGIEAQAADISFLIAFARTLPDTDPANLAVGGFSWGGISNLFAAARDPRITALFALDGSMRYFPGLVKQSGYVHPDRMTIPLLFFTEGEISLEDQARDFTSKDSEGPNVLNQWTHGDLITVDDLALVHTEHSSMYQRNEEVWKGYALERKGDYVREDGIAGYAWVCRYTLSYLDAYLKHDVSALAWLKKTALENGAPPHLLTASFRAASGPAATLETFRAQLGLQGFDNAPAIYAAMKKDSPDFKLEEAALTDWGGNLVQDDHLPEAFAILKLAVQLYPDSSSAYEDLGEAYARSGDKPKARVAYRKALEKDATNDEAKQKLNDLDAK